MKEIVMTMTDEEFEEEMQTLAKRMKEAEETREFDHNAKIHYLIGWVTAEPAPMHTPAQLEKIFELAHRREIWEQ